MINPNDFLAGVNLGIALAMLLLAAFFIRTLVCDRPHSKVRRFFLVVMGAGYILLMCDYGTTGFLRIIGNAVYPGIPHSLLPDFAEFPVGFVFLMVWRSLLLVSMWTLVIYVIVVKRGVADE